MSNIEHSHSASSGEQLSVAIHDGNDSSQSVEVTVGSTSSEIEYKKGSKRKSSACECFIDVKSNSKGVEKSFVQNILNFLPFDADIDSDFPTFYDPKNYDQQVIREVIAKMITVHEYPFMMVEHTWFNILLKTLNPNFQSVSRNTIKNDCMKVYEHEKKKLKSCLKNVHMVSLTVDCWTSNQTIRYMCLTAHYIDETWKIKKVIINFIELEPPYTDTYICDAICDCLLEWKLQDKISTITLDNSSNNDVTTSSLKANFESRGKLHFRGLFFHVRCCAHIINIMVQDGLNEVHEIIQNIRESVKYLKKSPARLHKFVEVAKQLGVATTRSLCIDVSTRWNSTFNMLESAFIYRTVFHHYAIRDSNYKWLPLDSEWVKYEKIRKFLSVFNNVTKMISNTIYPTSNIFLPAVLHVKKILIEESLSEDEYMRNMAMTMQIKFNKYWGECNLLMSIAAILDPRLKLKFISYTFPKIYSNNEVEQNLKIVQDALWEIYAVYVVDCNVSNECSSTAGDPMSSSSQFDVMLEFQDFAIASGFVEPSKPDLQIYLEEGLFVCSSENFDVLDWWKMNTLKYPRLSIMAKDILSIPITTVASESAFSAGGRVLDDYKSCLSTKTVNALICASSWLRSAQKNAKTLTQEIIDEEKLNIQLPDI